jgi:hypothetical protein
MLHGLSQIEKQQYRKASTFSLSGKIHGSALQISNSIQCFGTISHSADLYLKSVCSFMPSLKLSGNCFDHLSVYRFRIGNFSRGVLKSPAVQCGAI